MLPARQVTTFTSFIVVLILTFFACKKEFSTEHSGPDNSVKGSDIEMDLAQTVTNIQGFVIDEDNKPVVGALVKAGNGTATTNENGLFFLNNVNTSEHNSVITITKEGFFKQVKATLVTPSSDNFIKAQLIRKTIIKTINAVDGGDIELQSGARLVLPANAIQTVDGQAYNGKVNVYMHWMNPADVKVLYQMPGELRGITTNGTERMMITYGMINVELESEANTKLKLDTSKRATLSFPVPDVLASGAPASVPMWHFDETKGRWMEDGEAKLQGTSYTAYVNHFSCWNVDAVYDEPLIKYCIRVVDENDKPYSNSHILVRRANDRWGAHGYTNSDGYLCGLIPSNTPLILEVLGEVTCEQTILSKPVGPYKDPVDGEVVVVRKNPEKTITISGLAVDCNNQPVQDGYVQGTIRSQGFIGKVQNGVFEFTLSRCPADLDFKIFGYNEITDKLSDEKQFTITGNSIDVGTISICADPSTTTDIGLVAFYSLDGHAQDSSVNRLDGTITGAVTPIANRKGATGKALYFAGDGQYIDVPNTQDKNLFPISISLWFKADADCPSGSTIFSKYQPAIWNGFEVLYVTDTATRSPFVNPWYINSSANRILGEYGEPPFSTAVSVDTWTHFVFVVDDNGGIMYKDGKAIASKPWTGTAKPSYNSLLWQIGGFYNAWFKGAIDDVRLYNRALQPSEVTYLFEN